jgi:hypothetical protein
VIVESGAGDFWIDQSEFLLVGDWIWRLGFSLFVVLGECDCLFRRIGERERESVSLCVEEIFFFGSLFFGDLGCVRACVFLSFLFWGFESTLLQEFESRVRKASQDGAGGAGGSHLACPPTDEQRHSHR